MPLGQSYGTTSPPQDARRLLQAARDLGDRSALFGARRLGLDSVRQATPVAVARPGESRYRQRAYASIAAAGAGVPQDLFLEEALRLTPQGVPQNVRLRRRF